MIYKKTHTGFTLVELMITVGIIAVLTAIVMTNFANAKAKARDGKRVSDINQLQVSLELFFDRCGRYPIVASELPSLTDTGNGCPTGITLGTFLSKLPTAPSPGSYVYRVNDTTTPTDYTLQATLEAYNQALVDDIDTTSSYAIYPTSASPCGDTSAPYYYCVAPR